MSGDAGANMEIGSAGAGDGKPVQGAILPAGYIECQSDGDMVVIMPWEAAVVDPVMPVLSRSASQTGRRVRATCQARPGRSLHPQLERGGHSLAAHVRGGIAHPAHAPSISALKIPRDLGTVVCELVEGISLIP